MFNPSLYAHYFFSLFTPLEKYAPACIDTAIQNRSWKAPHLPLLWCFYYSHQKPLNSDLNEECSTSITHLSSSSIPVSHPQAMQSYLSVTEADWNIKATLSSLSTFLLPLQLLFHLRFGIIFLVLSPHFASRSLLSLHLTFALRDQIAIFHLVHTRAFARIFLHSNPTARPPPKCLSE